MLTLDPLAHGGLDLEMLLHRRTVLDGVDPADVNAVLVGTGWL